MSLRRRIRAIVVYRDIKICQDKDIRMAKEQSTQVEWHQMVSKPTTTPSLAMA